MKGWTSGVKNEHVQNIAVGYLLFFLPLSCLCGSSGTWWTWRVARFALFLPLPFSISPIIAPSFFLLFRIGEELSLRHITYGISSIKLLLFSLPTYHTPYYDMVGLEGTGWADELTHGGGRQGKQRQTHCPGITYLRW